MKSLTLGMTSLLVLLSLCSCLIQTDSPLESSSNEVNLIQSGDIVVANWGNDSILLLNPDGSYKAELVNEQTSTTVTLNGLYFDSLTNQVLFGYDHSTPTLDGVRSISLFDGSQELYLSNNNLAGALYGITRLVSGEILVIDSNNRIERFDEDGNYNGAYTGFTSSLRDVTRLQNGGFVVCSTSTSNTVRLYNGSGVLLASASGTSPAPSIGGQQGVSCIEDAEGNIIVAYSGSTDAVRAYSSNLATVLWTYTDTNLLRTPGNLALKSNGHILMSDTNYDHILELNSQGGLVSILGGSVLSDPSNIIVIR